MKFKGEADKAIADFTEAIRLNPKDAGACTNRGRVWSHKKQYDEAIADFTEVIRLDPKSVNAYSARGDAWSNKKEYDRAIADFTDAIRNFPRHANKAYELTKWNVARYLGTLAAAYAEVGDFESAVKWQSKANPLYADPTQKIAGEARLKLDEEKKPYRDLTSDDVRARLETRQASERSLFEFLSLFNRSKDTAHLLGQVVVAQV